MTELNPTHEVREGVDVVWQIPPNPKGVLFVAHSAGGSPFMYWPPSPNVPQGRGTPEPTLFVKQALERGFAVIAIKSVTSEWQPWPISSVDIQNTVKILTKWRAEKGLEDLPLSAFGTSIGGAFVSCLAHAIKLHALVIMIAAGNFEALRAAEVEKYPPTLWVPMLKDEAKVAEVQEAAKILGEKGIPTAIVGAPPLKVHRHFFAENIDDLDNEQSAKLVAVFVEHGIVAEDGSVKCLISDHEVEPYLRRADILQRGDDEQHKQDQEKLDTQREKMLNMDDAGVPVRRGRHGGERGPPRPVGGPPPHPIAHGVANQLKVAYGVHTLTSRHNIDVFDWCEGKSWPVPQS